MRMSDQKWAETHHVKLIRCLLELLRLVADSVQLPGLAWPLTDTLPIHLKIVWQLAGDRNVPGDSGGQTHSPHQILFTECNISIFSNIKVGQSDAKKTFWKFLLHPTEVIVMGKHRGLRASQVCSLFDFRKIPVFKGEERRLIKSNNSDSAPG